MSRRVVVRPLAQSDLDEQALYIAQDNVLRVVHSARDLDRIFGPEGR